MFLFEKSFDYNGAKEYPDYHQDWIEKYNFNIYIWKLYIYVIVILIT